MRLYRPFVFLKLLYPDAVFRINTGDNDLYLTFDDGPSPESTPRILDILEVHNVKATFFCNGQEAEKYPELVNLTIKKGHLIGNHGYHHLSGLKTKHIEYIENISRAAPLTSADLFRPPYGRLSLAQYRELIKAYTIVFWDLMPYDFDRKMSSEKVLNVLKNKIRPGSVIVLHDITCSTLLSFLGEFIKYAEDEGYRFRKLSFPGKNC